MNQHDQEFELRARQALDASVKALDADTRRHLAAGRARALDHESFSRRWLSLGNWVPATAFAAVAVLAVTLFVLLQKPEAPVQAAQTDQDFALELLLSNDDSQDAEADPDFYIVMEAMMDEEDKQHAS
jgi:anti-sigma-K factor RskA